MKQKKIIKIIIGTNNPGKLREIKDLLPKNLKIYSPKGLKIKSPKENGKSFKENSYIKAKYFSKKAKMICLADDSGLEIDLLNKKPGIFSSRWGGSKGNFKKAIKRVYKELSKKDKNWFKKKIHLRKCYQKKNIKLIIVLKHIKKLKNFFKLFFINFIKI